MLTDFITEWPYLRSRFCYKIVSVVCRLSSVYLSVSNACIVAKQYVVKFL